MNDLDLNSKLRDLRVPERAAEYWEDFPSRIRGQLRQPRAEYVDVRAWRPGFGFVAGLALVMGLIIVCVQFRPLEQASAAITKHELRFRAQLAALDAGMHRLMFNPHGMGYLLAETD